MDFQSARRVLCVIQDRMVSFNLTENLKKMSLTVT